MTKHLSPEQLVDAVDGVMSVAHREHVDACTACRAQLTTLRQVMTHVEAATSVPEPSPLFWDHFSRRVQAATAAEPPAPMSRWLRSWRVLSFGAMLAAAVMIITIQIVKMPSPISGPTESRTAEVSSTAPSAADTVSADGESWQLMMMLASDLSSDELHDVTAPMISAASTMAPQLTPAEQREFVRLIRHEIGGAGGGE